MRFSKEQLEMLATFGIDEVQAESIAEALQGAAIGSSVGPITKEAYEKLTLDELASCPFASGGMPLYKYYPDRIDPKRAATIHGNRCVKAPFTFRSRSLSTTPSTVSRASTPKASCVI